MNDFLKTYGVGSRKHVKFTDDPKVLDKAIKDKDEFTRRIAASNSNVTKEHLDQALKDSSHHVRCNVSLNPTATKEHLQKLCEDPEREVRETAKMALSVRLRRESSF